MHCKQVHVYRHRDMVAVTGDGKTLYLNAVMCHMLSKALQDGAFDILTNEPTKTNFHETYLTNNEVAV